MVWTIKDGWFQTAPQDVEFAIKPDKHRGLRIMPELILIHYAVTDSLEASARAGQASDYVSWQLSVDGFKEGKRSRLRVAQHVPFDRRAAHAGPTAFYDGRDDVNGRAIGIEVANTGPLFQRADGELVTTYGQAWKEPPVYEGRHQRNWTPPEWTHWARSTDGEYVLIASICHALVDYYPTITNIVGHDEVRQDKADPGPAFDMAWLRAFVFSAGDTDPAPPPQG